MKNPYSLSLDALHAAALEELAAEDDRQRVEKIKAQLRVQRDRSLWKKLFPFEITIRRIP